MVKGVIQDEKKTISPKMRPPYLMRAALLSHPRGNLVKTNIYELKKIWSGKDSLAKQDDLALSNKLDKVIFFLAPGVEGYANAI